MASALSTSPPSVLPPPHLKARVRRPSLPSSVLPKLGRGLTGSGVTSQQLLALIAHLRLLYAPEAVGDSAQPSDEAVRGAKFSSEVVEDSAVDPLHQHDAFERSWAVNWLGLIVKRGEDWVVEAEQEGNEEERQRRVEITEEAAALVAHLTATSESGSILRPLFLPTCAPDADPQTEPLLITLNDALPSSLDPTSVGLQSWGSSIILGRMIALDPTAFGLGLPDQRVLELGAGTGLLSLIWKGMCERKGIPATVIATDNHQAVLENLERNVQTNSAVVSPATSPAASPALRPVNGAIPIKGASSASANSSNLPSLSSSVSSTPAPPVIAAKLDWSAVHSSRAFSASLNPRQPVSTSFPPPFDKPFHTLLAADVIYGPTHALWLKSCVEQFLIKPDDPREKSAVDSLPREIADLSLGEASVPLPTRPGLNSTDLTLPPVDAVATSHNSAPPGSSSTPEPVHVWEPAFHLIVPLRPTHAEAIATLKEVFPMQEDLPPRDPNAPGGGWRVAVKSLTEIERAAGVGRADEEKYRLYRIQWC
ncbi:hypothetical protein JCM8547_000550 [Rhodosporidiobolus lusitaniae]